MENNKEFWDNYVSNFVKNPDNKTFRLLGHNWKGEQIFLELLKKYATNTATALEIGCGGGRITEHASAMFQSIIATDISSEMLRKASTDVIAKNIKWELTNGFDLNDIASNTIDVIFSHDVFVHFSSMQTYPYLRHILRVLKPDGIGLLSFYNFVNHFKLFKNESCRFNNQHILPSSMRHHFITSEMLKLMLDDLNYTLLETNTQNFLIIVFQKRG